MTRELPAGSVTFLFTDVEGSTRLLDDLGSEAYAGALAEHRRLLRDAFDAHGGVEVDTQGDASFIAFASPSGALAAASEAIEALARGPIRVRMGIHTGKPLLTPEGYVGPDVHRAARIAAAGHGGQVLVSRETREQVNGEFTDLGEHRLKDIATPVWIFQLGIARFPPLSTISNTNLPRQATTFVGRDREVNDLMVGLRDGRRLVTLTGPAGSGKTRLAIEASTRLIQDFRAGVFWVDLAPVAEAALVIETIAQTLGARQGLAEHIGERQMLLVIDNFEHVVAAAPLLADLVARCANLRLLVTSRERLRVRAEHEVAVQPLAEHDAVLLFTSRAGGEADAAVGELCRALDNLPLAVELAAARATVLSPRQMLQRLTARLDLLKGGRDAEPRQQTLRAAIEWSHDLLTPAEQQLFARMSVFAGGATLEAVEAVAGADLDVLQSLVDKNLIRHVDGRFGMLESIRAFASERLAVASHAEDVGRRHADYYTRLAQAHAEVLSSGEPEEGPVAALELEINNLRAAIDHGLHSGDAHVVRHITAALPMYWIMRGLHAEARSWLERALALDETRDGIRRRLLSALGTIAYAQNDHSVAVAAADEAATLATELGGASEHMEILRNRGRAALESGDFATAEAVMRERLAVAIEIDNGVSTSASRLNLAYIANKTGRHELAEQLLVQNLSFVRSKGQTRCEANTLAGLAETALYMDRDRTPEAALGARLAAQIRDNPLTLDCLELVAANVATRGEIDTAATLLAATEAARQEMGVETDEDEAAIRALALDRLAPEQAPVTDAWASGRRLGLTEAVELASSLNRARS